MRISPLVWRLLFAAILVAVALLNQSQAAECGCPPTAVVQSVRPVSWVFQPGRYTHDPQTGNRVAQYQPKPVIEPLPDTRLVTSGYSRSRVVLRGADGSASTYYSVQSYGNGRGGLDAASERIQDAQRGVTFFGGQFPGYPPYGFGPGLGYGGFPGGQFGPGFGPGPGFLPNGPRRLDPDAADGFRERRRRTPDRAFFGRGQQQGQPGRTPPSNRSQNGSN